MPRGPRIQFPHACYHVINRGNYRRDVFARARKKLAFERCLFAACERMGWVLYAYVIMRNHFHLALCTPRGNLARGMQWLETTFATRFNRYRDERGHLFQGRYHAPLIEPGEALARVINYIHLNPVRAGVVAPRRLSDYPHGSFARMASGRRRCGLPREELLGLLGFTRDSAGWRAYQRYLEWLVADPIEQTNQDWQKLSKGWAHGSVAWRQQLRVEHAVTLGRHLFSREENARINHEEWSAALAELLQRHGRTLAEAATTPKGAQWKLEAVRELRRTTSVTVPWLAAALRMGTPGAVRGLLSLRRR
jgi:REP element-mobilizing transposase RayT